MRIKKTGIWKFFSSIKLAIWLLAIITLLSLIGTFIPRDNIYSSWWFILFLFLLSLNLTVCLLNRLPLKVRLLGTFISHLSILVILLGASIGIIYGEKALIRINKGEEINSFTAEDKLVDLGFSIRLDDFIYTEHIDPKEKLEICSAQNDPSGAGKCQGCIAEIPTEIGVETDIADTGYKIKVLRYLSDFTIDTITKVAVSRSAEPNNPAIEVELKDKAGKAGTFWVFARFPDMHQKADPNFKFTYHWVGRRPNDFISKVTVLKGGKEVLRKDIRVNEPLSFGGYKFFQFTYDTEALNWSGLQAVKDPGVPVVYAGFLLLIIGVTMIFYVNPIIQRS